MSFIYGGWGGIASGGGASVPPVQLSEIQAFRARWPNVAEWLPDLTQRGFPFTLFRFVSTETLVAPVGTTFANSIRHRAITRNTVTATAAAVVREALADGSNGNASCPVLAGFETMMVVRIDNSAADQWANFGAFADAGSIRVRRGDDPDVILQVDPERPSPSLRCTPCLVPRCSTSSSPSSTTVRT